LRVRRFREEVEVIKACWTEPKVTYQGHFYHLKDEPMHPKPVQKPHPPIWMGVGHPDAIRRTARLADGWMGSGGSTKGRLGAKHPAVEGGAGAERARSADLPDLEAGVHVGARAR
jgi:alkanesulfonate monooxygenase SsuD/methylene tetrahydromethanopterin reductase-like flavin-dependent oxidoreductase (luciferase family)